jgi:hypothetical protein
MPEQRLTDGGLVRDNVAIGIAVPRAKDGVSLFVVCFSIAQGDDRADGNTRCIGIFE